MLPPCVLKLFKSPFTYNLCLTTGIIYNILLFFSLLKKSKKNTAKIYNLKYTVF